MNCLFNYKSPPKLAVWLLFGFATDCRAIAQLRLAKRKLTRVLRTVSPLRVAHCVRIQPYPSGFGF